MSGAPVRHVRTPTWSGDVRVLDTFGRRLRGLLGTSARAPPVLIGRCSSIHTVGMGYPIDVAFVDGRGIVCRVQRGLVPGRVSSCRGARYVLERPSRDGVWVRESERLEF